MAAKGGADAMEAKVDAARHRGDWDEAAKLARALGKAASSSGGGSVASTLSAAHATPELVQAYAHSVQAEAFFRHKGDVGEARKQLRKALHRSPGYPDALALLSQIELSDAGTAAKAEAASRRRGARGTVNAVLKASKNRFQDLQGKLGIDSSSDSDTPRDGVAGVGATADAGGSSGGGGGGGGGAGDDDAGAGSGGDGARGSHGAAPASVDGAAGSDPPPSAGDVADALRSPGPKVGGVSAGMTSGSGVGDAVAARDSRDTGDGGSDAEAAAAAEAAARLGEMSRLVDIAAALDTALLTPHRLHLLLQGLRQLCEFYVGHGQPEQACNACDAAWDLATGGADDFGGGVSGGGASGPSGSSDKSPLSHLEKGTRQLVVAMALRRPALLYARRMFRECVDAYRQCLALTGPLATSLRSEQRADLAAQLGRVLTRSIAPGDYPAWRESAATGAGGGGGSGNGAASAAGAAAGAGAGPVLPDLPASAEEEAFLCLQLARGLGNEHGLTSGTHGGAHSRGGGGAAAAGAGVAAGAGTAGGTVTVKDAATPPTPMPAPVRGALHDAVIAAARRGRVGDVARVMQSYVSSNTGTPLEWFRLALALGELGPDSGWDALRAVETALKVRRDHATVARRQGQIDEAEAQAARVVPESAMLLLAARIALYQCAQFAEAVRYAQAAAAAATEEVSAARSSAYRAGGGGALVRCWEMLGIAFASWARDTPSDASRQQRRKYARAAMLRACDAYWDREYAVEPPKHPKADRDSGHDGDEVDFINDATASEGSRTDDSDGTDGRMEDGSEASVEHGEGEETDSDGGEDHDDLEEADEFVDDGDDGDGDGDGHDDGGEADDVGSELEYVPPPPVGAHQISVEVDASGAFLEAPAEGFQHSVPLSSRDTRPSSLMDWRLCHNVALVLGECRMYKAALPYATQALTLRPSSADVWHLAALLTSVCRGTKQATQVVRAGMLQHPDSIGLLFTLARVEGVEHDRRVLGTYQLLAEKMQAADVIARAEVADRGDLVGSTMSSSRSAAAAATARQSNSLRHLADSRLSGPRNERLACAVSVWCGYALACAEHDDFAQAHACLRTADLVAERVGDARSRAEVIHHAGTLLEMAGATAAAEAQHAAAVAVDECHAPSLVSLATIALAGATRPRTAASAHTSVPPAASGRAEGDPAAAAAAAGLAVADAVSADVPAARHLGDSCADHDRGVVLDRSNNYAMRALRADAASPHAWRIHGAISAARGDHETAAQSLLTSLELEASMPSAPLTMVKYV